MWVRFHTPPLRNQLNGDKLNLKIFILLSINSQSEMKKIALLVFISSLLIASKPADDFVAMLKQKLEEYAKSNPSDQAILIFNQEKYAIADTAFFQAYLVNEDRVSIKGKKILALTIYDITGKLVQKMNFSIVNGKANNQLAISPTTSPGVYLFAISYAQNMSEESAVLFAKEILIVDKKQLSITKGLMSPSLQVLYESGFVNGIENTIIIQSNQTAVGKIKNSKNEEVVQFSVTKNKFSAVQLTPQKDESYYAEIESAGVKTPLIAAKNEGYIIKMAEISAAPTRKITILTPLQSDIQKKQSFLVVTNGRKITFSAAIILDDKGQFEINLPKEVIKNGVSYTTVFDEKGNVLAERTFFKYETSVVATLTPTTAEAAPRKKVSLELSTKDAFGNSVQGEFSVAIYSNALFAQNEADSFVEEALIRYPLYSTIDANLLGKELTDEKVKQIDYALAGVTTSQNPWSTILNVSPKTTKATSSSLKLKGRAIFKNSGKAVPDSTLIMGYLQNNMIGYVGYTAKDGRFELPFLYDFFGDDQLFYLLEQNGKEMTEPFEIVPEVGNLALRASSAVSVKDSADLYGDYVQKKRIVEKSYNFYAAKNAVEKDVDDLNARFEEEAMGVDMNVNVQDYISFPTMEDLVREVIPFLQNKKKGTTASVRLLINQNTKNTNYNVAKGEPLFIIDGILTKNINSFLGLKPVDILTIKIINDINKLNRLGPLGKYGVVLVKTKKPSNSNVLANSTILNIQGLTKPMGFQNINSINVTNSTTPDIRAFLCWTPSQTLNQSGKAVIEFYTSDLLGDYLVVVRGLTAQGEPFESSAQIKVNHNN